MKAYLETGFICCECGAKLWLLETIETGVKNLHHYTDPLVRCSAEGQNFERPTIVLKRVK